MVKVEEEFNDARVRKSFAFEQQLAQETETLEVRLPPGPSAYCSPRLQGKRPKDYSQKKTYHVMIEHGAHSRVVRKAKVAVRTKVEGLPKASTVMQQLPSEDDSDDERRASITSDDSDSEGPPRPRQDVAAALSKQQAYYAKASFRQHRAPAFGKAKLFPVLVNRRLVPEWREPGHVYDDNACKLSPRQRTRQRLVAPTLACSVRQHVRRPPEPPDLPWHPHMNATMIQHQNSRGPALCHDTYKPPEGMHFRDNDSEEAKRLWVAENTFACPSLAGAKNAIVRSNGGHDASEAQGATQEARVRGARNNERLQYRYEMRLEAFKDEQDRRGPTSSFAKRELQFKADQGKCPEAIIPEDKGFHEGMFAMGFARFKKQKSIIAISDEDPPQPSLSPGRRTITARLSAMPEGN